MNVKDEQNFYDFIVIVYVYIFVKGYLSYVQIEQGGKCFELGLCLI